MLTLERAKEICRDMITSDHLILHCNNVSGAMGAMAEHFGEDKEHWMAVGYLHDYDFDVYPEEHLHHTENELLAAGVDPEDVRAVMAHGYGICTDVEPVTNMEKALFAVDELTGIIQASIAIRPTGISDLGVSSVMKKFKNKKFAEGCDRDVIKSGCEMLGMEVRDVCELCIKGMKEVQGE